MSELLKSLPKKIKISYEDIGIELTDDPHFKDHNFGEFNSNSNKITLCDNLEHAAVSNTLLHEIIHCAVWYGGLKDDGAPLENDNKEEHVVNVLTNQLCQIFRDNPKILTVIKKGLKGKVGRPKKGNIIVETSKKILEKYTFHKNRK